MAEDRVQEGETLASSGAVAPTHLDQQHTEVVCPRCGRITDSLKIYDDAAVWEYPLVASCPDCMRRSIRRRAFIWFPWSLWLMPFFAWIVCRDLLESRRKGHSDPAVAEAFRMNSRERFELMAQRVNLHKIPRREWILFSGLLVLIAVFWVVILALVR
jgi:hypothetical protein